MEGNKDSESVAAWWIAKRAGDHWSDVDDVALNQWLQESTRNRVAFVRANTGWKNAARLKALSAGIPPGVIPKQGEWHFSPFFEETPALSSEVISPAGIVEEAPAMAHEPSAVPVLSTEPKSAAAIGGNRLLASNQSTSALTVSAIPNVRTMTSVRPSMHLWAIAASVFVVMAAATWSLWPSGSSYRTPIGGLASVPISDGSKVTLSTDSEIRVALTETERRVSIERGEVFFEVVKDSARPFVVIAGEQRIVVIGTAFSVRRDAGDVRVVVTEGRVRVEDGRAGTTPPLQLAAGDVARASTTGMLVQAKPLAEAEEYLSWRSGYLVFRDVTLADAVAEFNRYNLHRLVIDDKAVAAMRVGGKFRSTNVGGFLRLLEAGYPVRTERRDGGATSITMDDRR